VKLLKHLYLNGKHKTGEQEYWTTDETV
jgi:hypothetical protein